MYTKKDFKIIKSKIVFDHYKKIRMDTIILPNKKKIEYSYLNSFYHAPGYSAVEVYCFLAKDLEPGKQDLELGEFLEVEKLSFKEVEKIIFNQTIEAGVAAAYLTAKNKKLI